VKKDDKGALVQLQYGLEAFAPTRHLRKEDETTLNAEDTAQFVVLEFDRNEKKILVSHSRTWEQAKIDEKEAQAKETKDSVKKVQDKVEKATLGDLGALADIKNKMKEDAGK